MCIQIYRTIHEKSLLYVIHDNLGNKDTIFKRKTGFF